MLIVTVITPVMAAGSKESDSSDEKTRIVLYMNGNLGDKSFFDSAYRGMQMAEKDFDIITKSVEGGYDTSRWAPDIEQLCQGDWDIIIAGTWQLQEIIQDLAPQYPEKKFFVFDTAVDYSKGGLDNVYSILYKQNEGSFLAGVIAGLITTSDLEFANTDKKIGFIGGMDIPVINDFKVGFIQGAKYVDPDIECLVAYVGNFNDPAKGKELSLVMFDQGVDIAFNGAAQAGLGLLDAGSEKKAYTIGVDSDQYLLYKEGNPNRASFIVTSMLKNVDTSLYRAIKKHIDGTLKYGEIEKLGIEDNGVGLADNENYRKIVSEDFIEQVTIAADKIQSGEIVVDTVF
ncbi:MAG: BMP family ABC transporter substrate-binding protein [Spirochaetales bacterium]|nr:BMP family ABC transporter substrate-binding protein [Spirochaetales bacterium]